MKPDKGNGIVIVDTDDYLSKMNDIPSDASKFIRRSSDSLKEILKREKHLRNFLLKLNKYNIITLEVYEQLAPACGRSGILYGLPMLHKANLPFRPILSDIGTHSYTTFLNLISLLAPLLTSPYILSDTLSFLHDLRNTDLDTNNVFITEQ